MIKQVPRESAYLWLVVKRGAMRDLNPLLPTSCMLLGVVVRTSVADSGYALEFDGIDDWVEVADPVYFTGPMTLEVWIRPDAFAAAGIISNTCSVQKVMSARRS